MLDRMGMIGEIRQMIRELYDESRFELVKEIMGGIYPDNFSGVPEKTVTRIWAQLSYTKASTPTDD